MKDRQVAVVEVVVVEIATGYVLVWHEVLEIMFLGACFYSLALYLCLLADTINKIQWD